MSRECILGVRGDPPLCCSVSLPVCVRGSRPAVVNRPQASGRVAVGLDGLSVPGSDASLSRIGQQR